VIETFLRPPRTLSEAGADALRGVGTVSVILAAVFFDWTDAGIVAFALPGLFVPRFIGMVPWADAVFSASLLVAAWSNVFDLYTRISWWDLAVHFTCAGVLGAVSYLVLARLGLVAAPGERGFIAPGAIVITAMSGLALGALWEMVEWVGYAYISDEIFVTYNDTIGDLAVGGLGALCAGFVVAFIPLLRPSTAELKTQHQA
jgi:hypothetical protein